MVNDLLNLLDNRVLRWLLVIIVRVMYAIRSKENVQKVYYADAFRVWGYQFEANFFWNTGPGWITSKQHFESQLLKYFANQYQPKQGDVVIDLGAGLGEETIVLAGWVGSEGQVYSIEATPRIAEALMFAKAANHLQNVSVFNLAISDKSEPLEISDEWGYVGNTIQPVIDSKTNLFKIHGLTLDDFFQEHGIKCVDLLKVNIEGAEQLMIMGMENAVSKIKNIAISCHDFRHSINGESEFYKTLDKVRSYFDSKGFKTLVLHSEDVLQRHIVFGKNLAFKP
jgi:FkbM family methyltransferase